MSPVTPTEGRHRHRYNVFIPAGVLIGLGVGILLNQIAPGIFIGLGLGMAAAALAASYDTAAGGGAPSCCGFAGVKWVLFAVGIFLILLGIGFIWTIPFVWPYLVAALLIILGIAFVVRALLRRP